MVPEVLLKGLVVSSVLLEVRFASVWYRKWTELVECGLLVVGEPLELELGGETGGGAGAGGAAGGAVLARVIATLAGPRGCNLGTVGPLLYCIVLY